MTLSEKKELVLQMLSLYPSTDWYKQCIEVHMTADEVVSVESDPGFLKEVQGILFMEKQKLIRLRLSAIEISASRGGWQGYDKLLQEIDGKMFILSKELRSDKGDTAKVEYYLPENGR